MDRDKTGHRGPGGDAANPDAESEAGAKARSRPSSSSLWRPAYYPLHPFLFAAVSVIALYARNVRETSFPDIAWALVAVLSVAAVLFVAFGVTLRNVSARPAILASICLIVGLWYESLVSALSGYLGGLPGSAAPPIVLVAAATAIIAVWRTRLDLRVPNAVLNGIALAMFLVPAWQAAASEWRNADEASLLDAKAASGDPAAISTTALGTPVTADDPPDIYYLIFDRYASQADIAEHYGFDNQAVLDFLRQAGFYVAPDSHSNYFRTAHSLASTFRMDYLDFLSSRSSDWSTVYELINQSRVAALLKSSGYRFVQIGSWWAPTQRNPNADETFSFGFSEFNMIYARGTVLRPLLELVAPSTSYARSLNWDYGECQRLPAQIEAIRRTRDNPGPQFVFAHILLPHDPYVFDPEGRCLSREASAERGDKKGYVDQLRYANTQIRSLVSTLLDSSKTQPIVIIQADEGPFPERYLGSDRSWRDADASELRLKTGILNAYFFPDNNYSALYPEITPVNSFRILFNKYFGTDFSQLPDRVYALPNSDTIYEFIDVTDIVACRNGRAAEVLSVRQYPPC